MEEAKGHGPPEALSSLKKASERKRQIPGYPQSSPGFRGEVHDKFNTGMTCPRLTPRAVTNGGEMPPSHLRGHSSSQTHPHLLTASTLPTPDSGMQTPVAKRLTPASPSEETYGKKQRVKQGFEEQVFRLMWRKIQPQIQGLDGQHGR